MVRKKTRPKSFNAPPIKLKCSELIKSHLQHFESFIKISASSSSQKYKIGDFPIVVYDVCDFVNDTVAYLHFKEDSTKCFLWWEEINDGKEKQVKFSYATCEVPYDVLKALTSPNQFQLICEITKPQSKNICIHVYIGSNLIVALNYASEPHMNRFRSKVQTVVKHFYGIAVEEYGKDFIDEEDHVEKVYECIKNRFDPNEKVLEVSHPSLIPKLRDYQSQAVHWMLKCESRENSCRDELDSHALYSELLLSDGSKLYYQIYGGFFVSKQFTSLPLARGGILADEMGLGKTVEVLACILLHPRMECISQKEQVIVILKL
ncbi:E3 ubiquitin-protein ligase SHPRH [Araneus ventricosus]|uniref:E3 ubiquitin-protein ligase SHPRH n=1 Tax=Araneus ventricosus TaxID=182803 RepID=A0A4Y2CK25_ARAVE|nr:E3 ubiquitin-protein ligase SHPRH [Araneus ventricosus]